MHINENESGRAPDTFWKLATVALVCSSSGCTVFGWSPGIGDPSAAGWLTVLFYFYTAFLCLKCVGKEKSGPPRPLFATISALLRVVRKHWPRPPAPARRALSWLCLSSLYAFLGVNKQLDLQSLVTAIGRVAAHSGGWYESRRAVQMAFVLTIFVLALISMIALFSIADARRYPLVVSGVVITIAFVVIRASSFHEVDWFIHSRVFGAEMNWIFEWSGIGLVALGAHFRLRHAR